MPTTTFTAEQQTLHNSLKSVDPRHLTIARDVMTQWLAAGLDSGPDPEDLGAPVNSPAWTVLEDAFGTFDDAAAGSDEEKTRAALDVTNAILAATR